MKKVLIFVSSLTILLLVVWVVKQKAPSQVHIPSKEQKVKQITSTSTEVYQIEEVISDLEVPWGIVFMSDTEMLVTERPGRIRLVENGNAQTLYTFSETVHRSGLESGLMGIARDPDDSHIYVCISYGSSATQLKVVRLTYQDKKLTNPVEIFSKIPSAKIHSGCRLAFGPDKKLYITVGDAQERTRAQDTTSLDGKILRVNADGTIPSDNPFPNSAVWSYGHRNPQGLSFAPDGTLYETEHGPTAGVDGSAGGDEVNLIKKGANYGWPNVSHDQVLEGAENPLKTFTPAEAPGSVLFYTGTKLKNYTNNLFFGALKGQGIMRLTLKNGAITSTEKLPYVSVGRVREVVQGPDGSIYFSTSNRDGRGTPKPGDDMIYKIIKK